MTRRFLSTFRRDQTAAAAAEMALMVPLLLVLLFGSMEAGHFIYREHQIVNAAREAARFAGRQPLEAFDCDAGEVADETEDRVAEMIAGTVAGNPTVLVEVADCIDASSTGLYVNQANGIPVAIVSVSLEYPSLFSSLGFDTSGLTLNARAQSPVTGL